MDPHMFPAVVQDHVTRLEVVPGNRSSAVVASPVAAALMAGDSDLVARVPERLARYFAARLEVAWFAMPTERPAVTIHQQWHGRLDHDPPHRWLRGHVREASV
ncbi:hypothetical protein [Rhodococcus erythropolis]|uniref:hypothetical protein n=1 Tax=Rhodococcus erythropolis TaxID=1833 RepID=UPI003982AF05